METPRQTAQDGYLEYYGRLCASQICPDLDIAWRKRLEQIFSSMSQAWCENIYQELLAPAGILWSRKSGEFGRRASNIGLQEFVNTSCPPQLQPLATQCLTSLEAVRQTDDAHRISRLLEDVLDGFDAGAPGADGEVLPARRTLLEKYIRTAGDIIKKKKELTVPAGQRRADRRRRQRRPVQLQLHPHQPP